MKRVTNKQIEEMKYLAAKRMTQVDIAEIVGVSPATVHIYTVGTNNGRGGRRPRTPREKRAMWEAAQVAEIGTHRELAGRFRYTLGSWRHALGQLRKEVREGRAKWLMS